jgi:hypothetical protein
MIGFTESIHLAFRVLVFTAAPEASMPARRVVYTCLFGYSEAFNDYAYEADGDIDFICFTDDPNLTSEPWQIRFAPKGLLDAPRASKRIKHLPHRYLPSYGESLYIDNTMHLKTAPRALFDDLLPPAGSPWTVFRHPWRQCVYDEAMEVIRINYDDRQRIEPQTQFYQRLGYPRTNGLVTSSVLLRRHNDPAVIAVGEDWFQQILRHSLRDQISFNVVAWHHRFEFGYHDLQFLNNEYVERPVHSGPRVPGDFNDEVYMALNPDVIGIDPRQHYLMFGIGEGRRYK